MVFFFTIFLQFRIAIYYFRYYYRDFGHIVATLFKICKSLSKLILVVWKKKSYFQYSAFMKIFRNTLAKFLQEKCSLQKRSLPGNMKISTKKLLKSLGVCFLLIYVHSNVLFLKGEQEWATEGAQITLQRCVPSSFEKNRVSKSIFLL